MEQQLGFHTSMISKEGNKYILRSKKTGKVLGKHISRAAAMKQEAAIEISKAKAAGKFRGKK